MDRAVFVQVAKQNAMHHASQIALRALRGLRPALDGFRLGQRRRIAWSSLALSMASFSLAKAAKPSRLLLSSAGSPEDRGIGNPAASGASRQRGR